MSHVDVMHPKLPLSITHPSPTPFLSLHIASLSMVVVTRLMKNKMDKATFNILIATKQVCDTLYSDKY
jgi:hypothetical protein